MKFFLNLVLIYLIWVPSKAQYPAGKVIVDHINATTLKNAGGENPIRRVTVYLPPGYDSSNKRYPVIYYLHGFLWSDSMLIAADHWDKLLDKAIAKGIIRPVIVVMPNEHTLYGGSFYTNSSLTGNWTDFTGKELVTFIDGHYKTLATRDSRAISGHSMGGHGAIKTAMIYPDICSCMYAFSPGVLALDDEFGKNSPGFKRAGEIKSYEELVNGKNNLALALLTLGRAYSPNPNKPPFYCDLPYTYKGDSIIVNNDILNKWKQNTPFDMTDRYADNLRKLVAFKIDWGRNDEFTHIPPTCLMFSKKLEKLGVPHYAEEYIGTHGSKIMSDDGRALTEQLPFFNTYLKF